MINFDAPEDRDTYVHRVGRTGRAGATGAGVSFVLPDQARDMRRIAQDLDLLSEFDHEAPAHVTGPPREMSPRSNGGGHRGGQGQQQGRSGGGKGRGRSGGQGRGRASDQGRAGGGKSRHSGGGRPDAGGANGDRPKARPNSSGTARGNVASLSPAAQAPLAR